MSKAALSEFLVKQAFMDASAKHLGLEGGLYHGDTESHPYVQGTLKAEQIVVPAASIKPITVRNSSSVLPQRSFGDLVTQRYADLRAKSEQAAKQTPKP